MSFSNDDGLTAKEIINGENPEDIEGVSTSLRFQTNSNIVTISLIYRCD